MADKPISAEMHPGPGFRIRPTFERPGPEVLAGFAEFDTPAVSDLMNRLYTMQSAIANLTDPKLTILGPACTVKVFVDAGASPMNAVLGDLISTKARHRGIGGFVVDGLIRDLPAILELGDFPVFARGVTPIGPLHRGPGEINVPICCGGIVVHPGDIVMGDLNGTVIIPRDCAEELLDRLREQAPGLAAYTASVARGEFSNAWVDGFLRQSGLDPDSADDLSLTVAGE